MSAPSVTIQGTNIKAPVTLTIDLPKETTYRGRFYQALENNFVIDVIKTITPPDGVTDLGEFTGMALQGFSEYHSVTLDGAKPLVNNMLTWCFALKLPNDLLYFLKPKALENARDPHESFTEDFQKGDYFNIAFNVILCAVDIAAIFDFLGTTNLVDLGGLANKIGSSSFYGSKPLAFLVDMTLERSFNYKLLALNAVQLAIALRGGIVNKEDGTLNKKDIVRGVKSSAEIAFRVYLLYFTKTSETTYLILGILAKGTGLMGTCYNQIGAAKAQRSEIFVKEENVAFST